MIPVFRLLISFINFVALELNKIANLTKRLGQAIGFERRFQQCFSYIVAVSFAGGGNPTHFVDTDKLCNIMSYRVRLANTGESN